MFILIYSNFSSKQTDFSQYHHPAYRSRPTNQFSSRTYTSEEQNIVQHHKPPPSVIFGQRVAPENKYVGHLNALSSNSNKEEALEDEYFDYEEYVDDEDDEYYDYDYEDSFKSNLTSTIIPIPRNNHIPLRSPNSNPISKHKIPPTVSNRRNSYVHYNHHGTYLPLTHTPSNTETHYGSYEPINRRPHRYLKLSITLFSF